MAAAFAAATPSYFFCFPRFNSNPAIGVLEIIFPFTPNVPMWLTFPSG